MPALGKLKLSTEALAKRRGKCSQHREKDKCSPVGQAAVPLPLTGSGRWPPPCPHPRWPCQNSYSRPEQALLRRATPLLLSSGRADFANRANVSAHSVPGGHTASVPEHPRATDISVQGHTDLLHLKPHMSARGWGRKTRALTLSSEVWDQTGSGLLIPFSLR